MRRKITVAGSGALSCAAALLLGERDLARVVVVGGDAGAAADVAAAVAVSGATVQAAAAAGWVEAAGSQVVVVDAAAADLAAIAGEVARRAPDAVVVVAGAGEAAACRALLAATGFPRRRVVGAGGIVAAAHLRALLADELGLAPCDVSGMALGGSHEDAFVASATVSAGGVPVDGRVDAATLTERLRRTLAPGPYARAAAVREVAESILLDRRRVLPCLACCQGEYGLHGVFATVPVLLGAGGINQIVEVALEPGEAEALRRAAVS